MVIRMKKRFVFGILLSMVLGICSAKIVYSKTVEDDNTYFLQLGVYDDYDSALNDTKKIDNKLILSEDNKYLVYVGISKNKDNLKKISNIYNKLGYGLYIKSKKIDNQEFLINLDQLDKLLSDSSNEEQLNTINSVILSSYEEIVVNPRK